MKKTSLKWLALLMLSLFVLVGCGGGGQSSTPPAGEPAENGDEPMTFTIYLAGATPGGGGVWDMIGAGLAEAIMRGNKGSSVTVVPGGGVSDVPVVSQEEAELGLTHSVIAFAGTTGDAPFEEVFENIKGVVSLYESQLQFIVNPNTGIETIGQIKEEKIPIKLAVGDPGSTGELATMRALQAYGITYADIESWGGRVLFKDMGEAATMYGDDIIDGFTLLTLAPNAPLQQVATNRPVRILPIDQAVIDEMESKFGYTPDVVRASAYDFLDAGIPSFSSRVVVITNDARSEQEVYQITKSLIDNLDYIRSIHVNLQGLDPEEMILTGVALHPGAEKAYKEAGVL